jgi:hypothetical protein
MDSPLERFLSSDHLSCYTTAIHNKTSSLMQVSFGGETS